MYRTYTCGELRKENIGLEVTLAGWIQTVRKFGSITFIDLRDRYGITQILFDDNFNSVLEKTPIGREFVIQTTGKVIERSNKNKDLPTGDIEIKVTDFKILNASSVPPFTISADTDGGDDLRMRYRYLDLRRPSLQKNLELRFAVNKAVRTYLNAQNFIDIETPFLIKSTPEGARDFVVPSRMNEGEFYALPQSPQTFKQLLMVSGYDRYYQIVRCFRDEDLRADRQPEFTQIDCEMSFVEREDVLNMFEGLMIHILKSVKNIDTQEPIQRITWQDAMEHYGNDKPDVRFDMRLKNLNMVTKGKNFKIFDDAELVIGIVIKNAAEYTRKQLDEITEWVKRPQIGMTGMAYVKYGTDNILKSSFDKFFNEQQLKEIATATGATHGDLILILSGKETKTRKAMSELRLEMATRLGLRKSDEYKLLWVLDFPLLEYNEEDNRWYACHHPFTSPLKSHINLMDDPTQYANIKANAYDLVLNGNEIGGGSIRIFQRELQEKMFTLLGLSKEEYQEKFGFLLDAFNYGTPPHGGIAFGFDRICALLSGSESIRDVIAFPKNNTGRDTMLNAPGIIDDKQKKELGFFKE